MDQKNFQSISGLETADLILITGDITNFGHWQQAKTVLDTIRGMNNNILALPGNLDEKDVTQYLDRENISLHGRGYVIEEIGVFGVGGSNITPFNTPIEFSEDELAELLARAYSQVQHVKNKILVSHTPPLNTRTDRLSNGVHVGSNAVREFIVEKQPDFCLCGHIHEARAEDRIGNTVVLNPGMIKDGCWIEVTTSNGELHANLKY